MSKKKAFNLINEIANDFFDQKGDWAAASGLSSALNKIINEYYASPNMEIQSNAEPQSLVKDMPFTINPGTKHELTINTHKDIKLKQVLAGEQAVMNNLKKLGLK